MSNLIISKIFYINLSFRQDRNQFMRNQLSRYGIPFERFQAIELTKEDLANSDGIYHSYFKRMVERFQNNINDEKYTRSIIANFSVYFSHYTIHKIASKLNFDNYLILEDDCLLRRQWQNILYNAIDSKIDKFDIIRSYRRNRFFKFDNCTWQSKYANDKSHNMSDGAHAIFINGKSAQKIVDYFDSDFVYNIDAVYNTHILDSYCLHFGKQKGTLGSDIPHPF